MAPPRLPTSMKLVKGTFRGEKSNPAGPKLIPGLPPSDDWLSTEGKRIYADLVEKFGPTGIGASIDQYALELLAESMAEYLRLRELIAAEGMVMVAANGFRRQLRPEVKQMNGLRNFIFSALAAFGATPSSRSKVKAVPVKEEEEIEKRYFK